jgi:hypothetical protein
MALIWATLLVSGTSASAAAAHRLALSLPPTAHAGASVGYAYAASGFPRGTRVALQRQEGTADSWRTVASKPAGNGSGQLAALPLGRYAFRLAVIAHSRRILAQQHRVLEVYGQVPLSRLFALEGGAGGGAFYTGKIHGGVYTTPTGTFPYAMQLFANEAQQFTFTTTSTSNCDALNLEFVPGEADSADPGAATATTTLSVLQQTLPPASATAAPKTRASLSARLAPGTSWSITTQATGANFGDVYVNGYGTCFSAEPLLHA